MIAPAALPAVVPPASEPASRPVRTPARGLPAASCAAAQAWGRAAVRALHDELALAPKPGLVTPHDPGSHDDMDAQTFWRSLRALRHYFPRIAAAGVARAPFEVLQTLGLDAEARMRQATGGINTHRGAVFGLGLLCAAAGAWSADAAEAFASGAPDASTAHPPRPSAPALRASLRAHWGPALAARARERSSLPGGIAAQRHGLRGAAAEAAAGFPVLFECAFPALQAACERGLSPSRARLDALFHTMAVLDDCNLAHRGGLAGLRHGQARAREFLAAGGADRPDAEAHAAEIGRDFVQRRLSPGGAADTLAAACWLQRVTAPQQAALPRSPRSAQLPQRPQPPRYFPR